MNLRQTSQPIKVLLVEDNPADVFITREALKREQDLAFDVQVVTDGERALSYLSRQGTYENASRPDLVLLDLNIPKVDGPQVLSFIRHTPELQDMLVIVLSSSPHDIVGDAAASASWFIQKPPTLDEFLAIGQLIAHVLRKAGFPLSADAAAEG
jgi:two-component system, chemotaxis family, response regulator Rcp1